MSLQKRIQKEFRSISKAPLIGAGVSMREEDCTIWDCVLELEFSENRKAPIHFVVQFPETYPLKAPMVGFSVSFNYTEGASHFIQVIDQFN
jgi:ubiquitin-protein ligase